VLTSATGETARAVIGEIETAALARLGTEAALSAKAIAGGGTRATEEDILATWATWYIDAVATTSDLETGGASDATKAAIAAAQARIMAARDAAMRGLTR
jgi:hypothetical protein